MPNSSADSWRRLLAAVGIDDPDELFEQIPAAHRTRRAIGLPAGLRSEHDLHRRVRRVLDRNDDCVRNISFLGAGCWQHYVPAVCDEIAGRSEFLTPVWGTPSSDFGRNQAWFEFASQLGELVSMDFVGLPVYSWGAAAGHALRMAARLTGRSRVVVTAGLAPERLAVLKSYCGPDALPAAIAIDVVGYDQANGRVDLAALERLIGPDTAAVYLESPNYLGVVEAEAEHVAALARSRGAETVIGVDPISLGILRAPGDYGADIVVGTTQPLGVHMNGGGGLGGFIATRDEERYAREYPTLQVSLVDTVEPGRRSFGMTLFEQSSYGARQDANDWTGNSVYLWTVVNAVYMALMGPQGFVEIGRTIAGNSSYCAERLAAVDRLSVRWGGFFKEFVVDFSATGRTVAEVNAALRARGIFGGKDLSGEFPDLGQCALYCVTEVHTGDDIDALTTALEEILR